MHVFLDGCSKWYFSVVFLNGQEEGHASGDASYGPCLVMGTSWSRDPLGFQQMSQPAAQREDFLEYWQMAEAAEAALEAA